MKKSKKNAKQKVSQNQSQGDSPTRDWNPAEIEMIAEHENDRKPAETHIRTIQILRDQKQFTFQEISDWFKPYGVIVDRNAIYRAYMNHLTDEQQRDMLVGDNEPPAPEN